MRVFYAENCCFSCAYDTICVTIHGLSLGVKYSNSLLGGDIADNTCGIMPKRKNEQQDNTCYIKIKEMINE